MVEGPRHSCGVVGICAEFNVVPALERSLNVIQHRGQESAGVVVYDNGVAKAVKGPGLVAIALTNEKLSEISGKTGIGHVRYSGLSQKDSVNIQPFTVETTNGQLALAHNGEITNYKQLRQKYLEKGWSFITDSDAEIIIRIIATRLSETGDPVKAIRQTMSELDGAYSLAIMFNDKVYGVRDPLGFRPLCLGTFSDSFIIVSESAALTTLGGKMIRDVMPGEIMEIDSKHYVSHPSPSNAPKAHCMFEWIYFARPDSIMDGREVYDVRRRVGMILAKEAPVKADLVMPIPDSGRAHALGYSIGSGIQYEEGFMKNRFVNRTFILPEQSQRENAVSMKMNPIRSTVDGKKIVIVDDSIVRGTTLKKLITMLRNAGAKEVHVRIGCPPVIAPCFYGVDMKTRDEFIANFYSKDEICKIIGGDSLEYISLKGLVEAVGISEENLCLACVNGKYPTKIPGETCRFQSSIDHF